MLKFPNCVVHKVIKRDSSIVPFDAIKIYNAVLKAINALHIRNKKLAYETTRLVIQHLNKLGKESIHVEQIQDIVEQCLFQLDVKVAKAYSLYRNSRHLAREIRNFLKLKDDLKFSPTALKVLEERYLLKDNYGNIVETPRQMFKRVAKAIAKVEKKYGKTQEQVKQLEAEFFNMLINLEFLPNSPTLMNAGTKLNQLAACFVLPIEDSLDSIFETLANMAHIQQTGGGTGFSFSKLRPKGDVVASTKGVASGPVSFMRIYDLTTEVIKQGGKRRGANMGILHVWHPDIREFINAKSKDRSLRNFNISVAVTDKFMKAVEQNKEFYLINPRTKKRVASINAKTLFDQICFNAWQTGDPGLIFIDEINRKHPLKKLGKIEATNPCGEVPLLPYEACNLGSINLTKMVKIDNGNVKFDWHKFEKTIRLAVRFLDNVIDACTYPLAQIKSIVKSNRKIGLGVMGLADLLFMLKIPYNSDKAIKLAEKIAKFMYKVARDESEKLGKEKGNFPNFSNSELTKRYKYMRNATVLSIAPTGSISIIAGCSSSIEPVFALAFERQILEGKSFVEINKPFLRELLARNLYDEKVIKQVLKDGNLKNTNLPDDIKQVFVTALEIGYEWHIKMQAAFQKYVDNSVSKTINLPENATVDDVRKAFLLAYKLKCKGITIYRYGSKPQQVLYLGKGKQVTKASLHFSHECVANVCYL